VQWWPLQVRTDDVHGLAQQQIVDVVSLDGAAVAQVLHKGHAPVYNVAQREPALTQDKSP
jgi:hypothetical protein